MLYTRGLLSSAAGVVEQSASGKAIGVDELQKVMNSSASDEQKTSFFIQYLLSQREWLLDFMHMHNTVNVLFDDIPKFL